jgi:hypothetical protein
MANIVRAFVEDMLPVLIARRAAARKSVKITFKPDAGRFAPPLKLPPCVPYRPVPDHHLRQSHL